MTPSPHKPDNDDSEPTEEQKLQTIMELAECLKNNGFAVVPWSALNIDTPVVFSVVGESGAVTLRKTENLLPCPNCDGKSTRVIFRDESEDG